LIGKKETIDVGPLCGKANVIAHLEDFGVRVPEDKLPGIVAAVKDWSAARRVSDADFILLAYKAVKGVECETVSDVDSAASSIRGGGTAIVTLRVDGRIYHGDERGVGAVDAVVKSICAALDKHNVTISSYAAESMGEGSHAKARVTLRVKKNGDSIESSEIGPDTVRTAIDSFVKGYNALCALQELRAMQPAIE
jgi:hypothetical protein